MGAVEHELDILEQVDHRRRVGDGDKAGGLAAGAVEMLMAAIERDREQRTRFPFEGDAGAGIVPHHGRAAPVEHQDHLFEQLALRRQCAAGRDFTHVAVIRRARGIVIDEHAAAAAARPRLELDRAQILHVERADDVEAFGPHPTGVGRFLFGRELLCEFVRDDCSLRHRLSSCLVAHSPTSTLIPPRSPLCRFLPAPDRS